MSGHYRPTTSRTSCLAVAPLFVAAATLSVFLVSAEISSAQMQKPQTTGKKTASVPQDVQQLRRAAEQGNASAQFTLGAMYDAGTGVARDYAQAMAWYRKAAAQGYADAQFNLGVMYARGAGVDRDDTQAVAWYRKAAEQGHAGAQYNLGAMYANNTGVRQDYAQAVLW